MSRYIITIGRQYGSAGREIGFKLAEKLGIKCYDDELLKEAAKASGLCEQIFETHDEKPTQSFIYSLVMDTYSLGYNNSGFVDMPLSQKVFLAQFDAIKKIADREACIIVGRCADYALADYKNVMSVFINADMEARAARIMERKNLTKKADVVDIINKTDKKRASYYNYYTSKKWGDSKSYDICINSSLFGVDGTVDVLADMAKRKFHI
ncbi:MAG: cytidylate kinase-like family protein [Lachnospiraceae bacterium]